MITAPAPNTARPWISRTGNESLKPVIRLAAPNANVSAASAEIGILRNVGCCPGIPRTRLLPHGPGDHESLDLVGALIDLRDLGIAQHPLDRVLLDVAVAAEHLHRLDGHAHRDV